MLDVKDFISNSGLFKKFEVDDLLFVEYKCLFEEPKLAYWTPNNYFVYVLGGKKKWVTMHNEYMVANNEALFIKRGAYVAHKYFEEDFCALAIFIPDSFIKKVAFKLLHQGDHLKETIESDAIIPLVMDNALSSYFHSVLSYFGKSIDPPKDLLRLKFEELIINVLINKKNEQLKSYFYRLNKSTKISIPEIMESNYTHNLSLEEFARLCGRSLSTFKRDFVEIYQETPGKWLLEKRLHHAKLLLQSTDLSVNQVTSNSGFENSSHFIKIFKKRFGHTPLKFRNSKLMRV